jgi:hypothetical protein
MSVNTRTIQCIFVAVLALFTPYLTEPVGAVYCSHGWDLGPNGFCNAANLDEIEDAIKQECDSEVAPGCADFCSCAYDVVTDICTDVIDWRCSDADCPVQYCTWDEDCCEGGCWEGECEGPIPPAPAPFD